MYSLGRVIHTWIKRFGVRIRYLDFLPTNLKLYANYFFGRRYRDYFLTEIVEQDIHGYGIIGMPIILMRNC